MSKNNIKTFPDYSSAQQFATLVNGQILGPFYDEWCNAEYIVVYKEDIRYEH